MVLAAGEVIRRYEELYEHGFAAIVARESVVGRGAVSDTPERSRALSRGVINSTPKNMFT